MFNFQTGRGNQRTPYDFKPKTYAREMARRLRQREKGMIP
jgi:hypothetical protein